MTPFCETFLLTNTSLAILMFFSFTGCKKASVRKVEKSIKKIGVVSVEKETLIQNAREAFDLLTVDEKDDVENAADLEDAESQLAVCKVDALIDGVGDFDDTTAEKIAQIEDEIKKLSTTQKSNLVNCHAYEEIKSAYRVWCVEQAIGENCKLEEMTYADKQDVQKAKAQYDELTEDEQGRIQNAELLQDAVRKIDELALEALPKDLDIEAMKTIINTGFSGNQITYTLDKENRNYIIEMNMNEDASTAYFLYPAIAAGLINSIKSNCKELCKNFYDNGTKKYNVDCTFIFNDCYGGEIFTIVNGEVQ